MNRWMVAGVVGVACLALLAPVPALVAGAVPAQPASAPKGSSAIRITIEGALPKANAKVVVTGVHGRALGVRRVITVRRSAKVAGLPSGRYRLNAGKKSRAGRIALPDGSQRYLRLAKGRTARVAFRYAVQRVSRPLTFTSLSAGASFTCGLTRERRGYCWGANWGGQLGTGHTRESWRPTPVAGRHRFTGVSAQDTTCGTSARGEVLCWGEWEDARTTFGSLRPTKVFSGGPWSDISGTCALTAAGAAWCWSWGTIPSPWPSSPLKIPGGHTFSELSSTWTWDSQLVCGLEGRSVWCWGRDRDGAFEVPTRVPGEQRFVAIGGNCGVDTTRSMWCWEPKSLTPRRMAGTVKFSAIADDAQPCGLDTASRAWCWNTTKRVFQRVPGGQRFASLADSGGDHRCALDRRGRAWCWGANYDGELGNGTTRNSARPVAVVGPAG